MIEGESEEPLVFFGGKSYFPLFCELTDHYQGPRVALFNSKVPPRGRGVDVVRFDTTTRTNWHYEAAKALLDGSLDLTDLL